MNRQQLDADQTAIFDKYGAFFAFSQEQYAKKAQDGIEYTSLPAGLITPKGTVVGLMEDLEEAYQAHIERTLKEMGKKKLIHYELANHEAQITYSIDEAVEALEPYGITREEVQAEWSEYMNYCIENDCF